MNILKIKLKTFLAMNNIAKVIAFMIIYPLFKIKYNLLRKDFPKVLDSTSSLEVLLNSKKSFSRFGDGEFNLIVGKGIGFQQANGRLGKALKNVLTGNNENCMIGLPNVFDGMRQMRFDAKCFWLHKVVSNWKYWKNLIPPKTYLDTQVSRFFMDSNDISQSLKIFNMWKVLWENQNIVMVEGESSKIGVGNDLFNNAKCVKRIICPSQNAFEKYDEILNEVNKVDKDQLILIALGPTASVLAFDLSKRGYRAIDIGHLDLEYGWMMKGKHRKSAIKGKAVNELSIFDVEDIADDKYLSEIVCRIE